MFDMGRYASYISVNIPAIHEMDKVTGLPVFVLVTFVSTSDVVVIYILVR